VGNVGGLLCLTLGKMGVTNIEVYDRDIVEEGNVAPQIYGKEHVGMNKVDALADIMKRQVGLEIETHHGEIDENSTIPLEPNTIYYCGFDSFEARRILWNKIKKAPVHFIDTRIGAEHYRFYMFPLSDTEMKEEYEKSIRTDAPESMLKCGEKGAYPINAELVARLAKNIKLYAEGKSYTQILITDWDTPHEHEIRRVKEI